MSNSVRVKEAVLVNPSEPTPNQVLHLSSLDSQLFLRFTVEYLLVYEPHVGLDKAATVARVKAALARVLVPYYPLAGRVRARADGSGLEVVCRAQGAVFVEAASESCAVSEFERAPKYGTQWRKFLSLHVDDVLKGAPPLVVQLTWLADGGATLGVGLSHCLCDGIGGGEFLNSFAELASGRRGVLDGLKPAPVWSRHLMDPTPHSVPCLSNHPEFKKVPDTCGFVNRFCEERLVPTSVTFDKKCLNELKKIVTGEGAGGLSESESSSPCTSFEVLSAHIWRSWARALNLPSKQVVKLLFSINIRNRVKPMLPGGYYGNAFVLGCAEISVKDLIEKGLDHATQLVKRAKERVDDGHVREVVESVSLNRGCRCPDSVGVLILSQWSRLGLNRVDFGMGRPVEVGPVCCDRYCILLPVYEYAERDAVKVNLAVPTSAVDQYLHLLRK